MLFQSALVNNQLVRDVQRETSSFRTDTSVNTFLVIAILVLAIVNAGSSASSTSRAVPPRTWSVSSVGVGLVVILSKAYARC